jgi:hypothetical protein
MQSIRKSTLKLGLRRRITCPHCWTEFPPHETRWVSAHPDLRNDEKVGEDAQLRFLPSRFNFVGLAIDSKGVACSLLACPNCHLVVPRAMLEMKPLFFSILGAPGSGKSYFLASMIWQLRQVLGASFRLAFGDADPTSNQLLNGYEETLFLNAKADDLVALPKTEKAGELYQGVIIGQRTVWFPKPFVFTVQPNSDHPNGPNARAAARTICLYDNAGEHFLPGGESPDSPGTQHLSVSQALLFIFDPTQHPQVRRMCSEHSDDPQMGNHGWTHRQDQVLFEAANRIRTQAGLGQNEKIDRPLIVVVTKYDAWCSLLGGMPLMTKHVLKETRSGLRALDVVRLKEVSGRVREMLAKVAPEMVSAVDSFSDDVTYIPASALGHSPEISDEGGFLGVRPSRIRPAWTEIPMIYALNRAAPHLVPSFKPRPTAANRSTEDETDTLQGPRIHKETGT